MLKGSIRLAFATAVGFLGLFTLPVQAQTAEQVRMYMQLSRYSLRQALPEVERVITDEAILTRGYLTCGFYNNGYSFADTSLVFTRGINTTDPVVRDGLMKYTVITVGSAWLYLCPSEAEALARYATEAPQALRETGYVATREMNLWTVKDQVNVRSEASLDSPVIANLPLHTIVISQGRNGEWVKVTVRDTGVQGYIRSDLLGMD